MTTKKELKVVYGITAYLLLVGILCYSVFSAEKPEEPIRIMFNCVAGKVLFDHKTHTDADGYALACNDCHHHPMDTDADIRACGDCHLAGDDNPLPQSCMECHDADDIEDTQVVKRSDAFHQQCIGCHQEFEAGPEDCSSCHVL